MGKKAVTVIRLRTRLFDDIPLETYSVAGFGHSCVRNALLEMAYGALLTTAGCAHTNRVLTVPEGLECSPHGLLLLAEG
jgi:hypothetical protein